MMYDSEHVEVLAQFKDGKKDGHYMTWWPNGQKEFEATFKDYERVSGKSWNSKGEEVRTLEEARK